MTIDGPNRKKLSGAGNDLSAQGAINPRNVDSVFAADDLFSSEPARSVFSEIGSTANQGTAFNSESWIKDFKAKQGEISPQNFLKILHEFDYKQDANSLLTNSDQGLEYLSRVLKQSVESTNYTNPDSKSFKEVLPLITNLARSNGLSIREVSGQAHLQNSKSVIVLLADLHDQRELHKKQANFLIDIHNSNIALSSGFVESEGKVEASSRYAARNLQVVDQMLANGYNPEQIVSTVLKDSKSPALNFKPEDMDTITDLKKHSKRHGLL